MVGTLGHVHLHQVAAAIAIGALTFTGLALAIFLTATSRESRVWAATGALLSGLAMILAYAAYVKLIK